VQLIERSRVVLNVALCKYDSILRKELFRSRAGGSAFLSIDSDVFSRIEHLSLVLLGDFLLRYDTDIPIRCQMLKTWGQVKGEVQLRSFIFQLAILG
jgi:hypothetical protein